MSTGGYVILAVVVAVVVVLLLVVLPRLAIRTLPSADLAAVADAKDRLALLNDRVKLRNDFRATCVSFIGGLGLIAGVLIAFGQFRSSQEAVANSVETSRVQLDIAQQAARNEQFVDAVKNLGDGNFAVRVAAVEVLDDIAQYGPSQAVEANTILRAFIRERSPWPPSPDTAYPAAAATSDMPRMAVRSPEVAIAIRRLGERALAGVATVIENADLRRVDLRNNKYAGGYFGDSDMSDSELSDADFTKASFVRSDLSSADLSRAKLCGASLSTANLTRATLTDSVADDGTTWPEGFDPESAGVRQAKGADCTP